MQLTAALVLRNQSTRPCLDFSRLKLHPIHLFKLSSFTILQFKGPEHILTHYAVPLEDGLTSTALKETDKPFNHTPFPVSLSSFFIFREIYGELFSPKPVFFVVVVYGLRFKGDSSFCQWSVSYSQSKLRNSAERNSFFLTLTSVRVSNVCLLNWLTADPVSWPLRSSAWLTHDFLSSPALTLAVS